MLLHKEITSKIIRAFYTVYNTLGYGFLEKVYENALILELEKLGLKVKKQVSINVYYNGRIVGKYFADLLVGDKIILELKTAEKIIKAHEAQLLNYLKATDAEVGFILNFGPEATYKRMVFTKKKK